MNTYENIKNRRKELKMSQEELAKKTGYNDRSMIAKIEAGLVDLSISKIKAFAEALKLPASELVGWEVKSNKLPSQTYKLLPNTAGAGLMDYELDISELETIDVPDQFLGRYAGRKDILILKVNGESMNKIIPDQSYVGIIYKDYDYLPKTGDIIVYRLRGEGLGIKRFIDMYDEIMLKPESTEQIYKEQRFKKETADDFEILGKVIMYNVRLD